jgi:hypothetical protein
MIEWSPTLARRVMAAMALVAAMLEVCCGISTLPREPLPSVPLLLAAGLLYFTAWRAMVVRSVEEGTGEKDRSEGRQIVTLAQFGGIVLMICTLMLVHGSNSAAELKGLLVLAGLWALGLSFHAFPKAYTPCAAVEPEPFIESEPAPERPGHAENPDLHRYVHVIQKLKSRGYR